MFFFKWFSVLLFFSTNPLLQFSSDAFQSKPYFLGKRIISSIPIKNFYLYSSPKENLNQVQNQLQNQAQNQVKEENKYSLIPYKSVKGNQPQILKVTIQKKVSAFFKLIRYKNLFPTFLLSFSGGWLMNPSLTNLFHSTTFIVAAINTLLIMCSSMILNDLFDRKVDKINNPTRPLITGEITIQEAFLSSVGLLGLAEYLSYSFLPSSLQLITQFSIIHIIVYTPFLKKILFIKNLACASIISFSVYFAGLASSMVYIPTHENFKLFSLFFILVFLGSLYNELLLDMCDFKGDRSNGIVTVPVAFGNHVSWVLSSILINTNILFQSAALIYLYNLQIGLLFFILSSPALLRSYEIYQAKYTKDSVMLAVEETSKQLFFSLLYFLLLTVL